LPVDRPGWGALVIERDQEASYSEAELDLCTEFAALATTAADEAAEAMQQRHAQQMDAESGAFRAAMLDTQLEQAMQVSIQKRKPVAVMRVAIDGFAALDRKRCRRWRAASPTPSARRSISARRSCERSPRNSWCCWPDAPAVEVRALGERICTEMRRHPLPGADGPLTVSVGSAQMQQGERSPQLALERSARALAKAQSYGGNQAQMVTGGTP
jgi:GGDEF domain-containing protein